MHYYRLQSHLVKSSVVIFKRVYRKTYDFCYGARSMCIFFFFLLQWNYPSQLDDCTDHKYNTRALQTDRDRKGFTATVCCSDSTS